MGERREKLILPAIRFQEFFFKPLTPGEIDTDADDPRRLIVRILHDASTVGDPHDASIRANGSIFRVKIARFHGAMKCSFKRGQVLRLSRLRNPQLRAERSWWKAEEDFRIRRPSHVSCGKVPLPGCDLGNSHRQPEPFLIVANLTIRAGY